MSNATRWYTTREAVKRAVGVAGTAHDALIDSYIEAASEDVDQLLQSRGRPVSMGIPITASETYRWPPRHGHDPLVLRLDRDLLAVTLLQAKAQDVSPETILATDYFLEPANEAPPYRRIEIDLSSSSAFESGATVQRSIAVTGRWGYSEETKTAGTLRTSGGINASVTTLLCSNGALIGIGDTLKIESEALFVSEKTNAAEENGDLLNGALTADVDETAVTVDNGSRYNAGETILVGSERMLIRSISSNVLTVERAVDGSQVAAHADDTPVHVFRTLTVVRGVNGTTAAAHVQTTAIAKYAPPADIALYCQAKAILDLKQGEGGWTGQAGGGEGAVLIRAENVIDMRTQLERKYGELTF